MLAHEVKKLPRQIRDILHWFFTRNDAYDETHGFEQLREFHLSAKGFLDGKTYDWFLSYYDLSLADIYLYRVGKPEQALELWMELLNCVRSQLPQKSMAKGYDMIINAVGVAVEYALNGTASFGTPLDNNTMLQSWSEIDKLNESYFWLYFGNWSNGKLEDALKWLREVKWQRGMSFGDVDHSPRSESTKLGYICCDYEYLLCEVDLLMRLGKSEEAIPRLRELLTTERVQQEPRMLARQVIQWLNLCSLFQAGTSFVGIEPEDEADLPSPSACSADNSSKVFGMPCAKLVQSQTGLEYHLQMLPVPYRLAIRYHANLGASHFNNGKWDMAIFEFEWCRELLQSLLHDQWLPPIVERACCWLSVWVAVPLAEIYHIRKMEFKAAFELRLEVHRKTAAFKENSEKVLFEVTSLTWIGAVLYQYAESSNDPILKHTSFEHLAKLTMIGARLIQFAESRSDSESLKDTILEHLAEGYFWSNKFSIELVQLNILFIDYFAHGEYVVALKVAQQLQQLFEERYSEHEDFLIDLSIYVAYEAECFVALRRFSEARATLDSYHRRTGLIDKDLPELVQKQYRRVADEAHGANQQASADRDTELRWTTLGLDGSLWTELPPEIMELKLKISGCWENNEFAKAVELSEELLHKTCNSEHYHAALFYISMMYMELNFDLMLSDCEFSFEELNAISEGETFRRLLGSLIELMEHPSTTLYSRPYLSTLLVMSQVLLADRYYEYFRSTWAPFTRFINVGTVGEELKDEDLNRQLQILRKDVESYLRKENPVERYSKETIEQFEVVLESAAKSKQYSESWIEVLQTHKAIYRYLQQYNVIRAQGFEFLILYDKSTYSSSSSDLDRASEVERHKWNAFLLSETERTRVMLYQLGFHKPNFNSRWELIDDDNIRNMGIIQGECANILEKGSFFVEYSLDMFHDNYNIYILNQDGYIGVYFTKQIIKLKDKGRFEKRTRDGRTFECVIKDLYNYFEPSTRPSKCPTNYTAATMNEDLEFLYEVLIKPIAEELAQMKPEHKLIFSVNELLTKVPFAALRNKEDQTYLIEHHTIAIAPSLKVLQICQERLTELRSRSPLKERGSIVALGDPKYDCVRCRKGRRKDLKWTRDEVEHIAHLFGDAAVVKLLQGDATTQQLRLCTSDRPDGQSSRQAIVHIGAHGAIDETKDRYMESSVIQLACPPCSMEATAVGGVLQSGGQAAVRNEVEQGDEDVLRDSFDEQDESDELGLHDESMKMMFDLVQRASEGASSASESAQMVGRGDAGLLTRSEACGHNLTMKEILVDMQMRVELVVLSACRTSRGRTTVEGVLSLARAFMIAGVPSIVASLWKVDDEATCALMKVFYDELRRGKDVACALRSSMLQRMNVSPRHRDAVREWAPFNVWGVPSLQLPTELLQNFEKECP